MPCLYGTERVLENYLREIMEIGLDNRDARTSWEGSESEMGPLRDSAEFINAAYVELIRKLQWRVRVHKRNAINGVSKLAVHPGHFTLQDNRPGHVNQSVME